MNGKLFLLDTNIIIALFADDGKVVKNISSAEAVFIPVIALGELFYGAELSLKREQNSKKLNEFSTVCQLLNCTLETAKHYGEIKSRLKKKGTPIPENDIWIAALAIQYELTLSTRDKHFRQVKDLKIASW